MADNCIGTIKIGDFVLPQTFEVAQDQQNNLNTLLEIIINDSLIFNLVKLELKKIYGTQLRLSKKLEANDRYNFNDIGIPPGMYSMNYILSSYKDLIPKHIEDALREGGHNMDIPTFVIDNSMYYMQSKKRKNVVLIYEDGELERVVLPDNKLVIANYIYYKYLSYKLNDENLVNIINDFINLDIVKENKFIKTQIGQIHEEGKNLELKAREFLRYYFSDTTFNNVVDSLTGSLMKIYLTNYLNSSNLETSILILGIPQDSIDKYGCIDLEELSKLENWLNINHLQKLKLLIDDHNLKQDLIYYTVEYISETKIKLNPSIRTTSKITSITVPTHYRSPSVPIYQKYKGYYIYRVNGKYHASKNIYTNIDIFHSSSKISKDSLYQLKKDIDNRILSYSLETSTSNIRLQYMYDSDNSDGYVVTYKNKGLLEGTVIEILDYKMKYKANANNSYYKELISSMATDSNASSPIILKRLHDNKDRFGIPKEIDIKSILDTNHKLNIFLLEASYIWELGNDVLEKISELLNNIQNANTKLLRITSISEVEVPKKSGKKGEMSTKYKYVYLELLGIQFKVVNKSKPFSHDLLYIASSLKDHFGVDVELLTELEVIEAHQSEEFKGVNVLLSRAFILNGKIYVNLSKASSSDLIHEYGHLMLGIIKNSNPKLYIELVSSVEKLPDLRDRINSFRSRGDTRALMDLYEEIIVTMFGGYIGSGTSEAVYSREAGEAYISALRKVFLLDDDVNILTSDPSVISNMSIDEVIKLMGSALLLDNNPFSPENVNETIVTRLITNILSDLIKTNNIEEICQ